ncbi:MAG TPA: aminoglycoside phosphotransferase family protein [Nocardioidaceae bacterium]|nr:aminoglycoside phosphotransferase family protein [Nocardioidaceae bacterium]
MSARDAVGAVGLGATVAFHIGRERLGADRHVQDPSVVPPSAEAMTPEWASAVLGAHVTDVKVVGGSDGTSSRRALEVTYADADSGLPNRLFSKAAASLFSRMLLGLTDIAEGESVFYNRVRDGLDLRSPRAHYAGYDAKTHRSFVLLEDLAVQGWSFPDPQDNVVTRDDAEDLVAELAHYHGRLWDSPRFKGDLASLRDAHSWQQNLNRKVGFERRTMRGFDRARDVLPAALVDRRGDFYPAFMRSLELHASGPQTLLHQDLHLGNWLRDTDGRMGLYDWQCVARGNWALDYSYALAGTLRTEDRRSWEEDLLHSYLARLKDEGVADVPGFDEAWLTYRRQPLHALAFAVFTLGGLRFEPELQPRDYTLAAIARIGECVADLKTLDVI